MEQIIIGFSKPKTWKPFAALIMWGYNILYDHVYVRIHSDSYDRDLIYQASGLQVNFMSPNIFQDNNDIVQEFTFNISKETKIKIMQFAIDSAGVPYGIKEVFGLAWVRICQLFGKTVKNPFSDGGATYVCSELAGFVLTEFVGIQLPKPQDDLTPLDIYNTLISIKTNQN